jgi:Protein of unknown function (DUF4242)
MLADVAPARIRAVPRYIIERSYTVEEAEVPAVATRSKRLARDFYPDIVWEHSHVVLDEAGCPKSFCVYNAPSEQVVESTRTSSAITRSSRSTRSPAT